MTLAALALAALLGAAARAEQIAGGGGGGAVSVASGDMIYAAMPIQGGVNAQMIVRRLAPEGGIFWEQRWGRGRGEEPTAIMTAPDGGVVVAGARRGGCFVARFDAQGRPLWEIAPVSTGLCRPADVVTDGAGGVYLLATIDGRAGYDAMVWRLSPRGDVVWTHRHSSNDPLYAQDMFLDSRGDRLHAFILRKRGMDFVEEFFRLDVGGWLL
ncbi:MAG: hypothetical protein HY403_06680 [Elusimicrobia bacterium]|nr:hypothetical protein [Elusimicrobiota bacterium]